MAGSAVSNAEALRNSNIRLCRLRVWPNFDGLGFNLEAATRPPHIIRLVESNSPAAAGGLKILDVVLEVNGQNVTKSTYDELKTAIKQARDSRAGTIDLLVCELRYYQNLLKRNIPITSSVATVIETPMNMPTNFANFPKRQPRLCQIQLRPTDTTFGFEVVNGERDIGAYIQEVFPGTPADNSGLRKSDRIIEIDGKNVENEVSKAILEKLAKGKSKRSVRLFVADTDTYKNAKKENLKLTSTGSRGRKSLSADRDSTRRSQQSLSQPPLLTDSSVGDRTPPTLRRNQPTPLTNQSLPDLSPPGLITPTSTSLITSPIQEDIRLCTINKADEKDTFGIELSYHRKEQLHSLTISPGRNNGPSNAQQAGVKTDDRLIEINGNNVQDLDHEQVTSQIKMVRYPQPLRILVADTPTFLYYKQQNQIIRSSLPNVRKMPPNVPGRDSSTPSSIHSTQSRTPIIPPPPPMPEQQIPSSVLGLLAQENPLSPTSMQPRNLVVPHDARLNNGVGFNFRTIQNDPSTTTTPYSHVVTSIDQNAPISSQGLRTNDFILSINDENVEIYNHEQLEDKLRRIANSETVRLLVADNSVYRVYKQSSHNGHLPTIDSGIQPSRQQQQPSSSNRRQYRLQRSPAYEGFGFGVRPNKFEGTPHQISAVEPRSPAHQQGLRIGDYILRVNSTNVEHMNPTDFNYLMLNLTKSDQNRDGTLFLEVMDEDTYRSLNHLSQTVVSSSSRRSPTYPPPLTDETYPKMRHCHVRPWPHYRDLGFHIVQSSDASGGGGYQIHQLRLDSPAAHTSIRNNDHLIEVNNINVEKTSFQYVYSLVNESYERDGHVSLLVIDDAGYQWYKRNRIRIDPTSPHANISRHTTPENQAVFTSGDTSVISPPSRQTPNEQMSDQHEIHIPPTSYLPTTTSRPPSVGPPQRTYPYTNGYISPARVPDPYQRQPLAPSVTSTLSHTGRPLSRAAVDVVDGKTMLRFCRLNTEPGQAFGFELQHNENGHIIRNVKPNSPAARSGLHDEDRVIEVNDEPVTNKAHRDVITLIRNASNNGVLRLLISPSNIKPLTVKTGPHSSTKTKSLPSLIDNRMYNDSGYDPYSNTWSAYDANVGPPPPQQQQPSMVKYMSTSRIDHAGLSQQPAIDRPYSAHGFDTYQRQQPYRSGSVVSQPFMPVDPYPRKCLLIRDPNFPGCGFKLLERENYDTPIVFEVRPNSPAKRSGLTEGDHIIYIDARNVQAINSFDEMTQLIHRTFEENGQITLVTLTGPAYQVLKRKGGYLTPEPFDYQTTHVREMAPRFCRINLLNHEHDFGFTLQRGNPIHIKDVHPGTAAYEYGLRPHDKLIEINGLNTISMSAEQIIDLIEASKRQRQLNILVIDTNGYNWSVMHAIPLNSHLPFVQIAQRRALSSRPVHQQPVYL